MIHATISPIRSELVAAKLHRIRNFELDGILNELNAEPRLAEVLWFLAFVSRNENYPGGLGKFTNDLIAQSTDLLGTAGMVAHPAPYSDAECEAICNEVPDNPVSCRDIRFSPDDDEDDFSVLPDREPARTRKKQRTPEEDRARKNAFRVSVTSLTAQLGGIAGAGLPKFLVALCEQPEVQFHPCSIRWHGWEPPWYFVRYVEAILRFIDRRKVQIADTIAETTVSREIGKWLDKARATGRSIIIQGNSRFGKTEAIRAWAAMHPGQARIVETPSSGGESELLRAVAKSLGIEINARQRGHEVRGQIEFVLQQFRPVLIFEEATFLFPANFSKNTTPLRLNWVRRSVMDAGIPCVFVWTPQTHHITRSRFLKATNYAIEQFDGRILRTVNLPTEIPREDLLAIARIHFRTLPERLREVFSEYVVCSVAPTERNYCSDVSNIAVLTFCAAEGAGRKVPTLEDLKAAIADVLPAVPELREAPSKRQPRKAVSAPAQPLGTGFAASMQAPCKPRETRPPGIGDEAPASVVEHARLSPVSRTIPPAVLPA